MGKVPGGDLKTPSIVIKAPKDVIAAAKNAVSSGHVEVDLNGILGTHLDVDIAAEENGVATIRVASPLIPKLPFKNLASGAGTGGKESEWSKITNLGSGGSYY